MWLLHQAHTPDSSYHVLQAEALEAAAAKGGGQGPAARDTSDK